MTPRIKRVRDFNIMPNADLNKSIEALRNGWGMSNLFIKAKLYLFSSKTSTMSFSCKHCWAEPGAALDISHRGREHATVPSYAASNAHSMASSASGFQQMHPNAPTSLSYFCSCKKPGFRRKINGEKVKWCGCMSSVFSSSLLWLKHVTVSCHLTVFKIIFLSLHSLKALNTYSAAWVFFFWNLLEWLLLLWHCCILNVAWVSKCLTWFCF